MQSSLTQDTAEADHAESATKRSGSWEQDTDLFSSGIATEWASDATTLAHDPGSGNIYTTVNSFYCFSSSPIVCPANSANQSFHSYVTATPAVYFDQTESQPSLEQLHSSICGVREPMRAKGHSPHIVCFQGMKTHSLTARTLSATVRLDVLS